MSEHSNRELLTRIAWLYYYEDQSQQEIGEQLGLPRIKITRLLKTIREEKIVDIRIDQQHVSLFSIEKRFKEKTGLQDITVVPTSKTPADLLSIAAAARFKDLCGKYERIGIGASRIVGSALEKIDEPIARKKVKYFVSLTGNAMPNFAANPYSQGWMLSKVLGTDFYHIWAPAVASSVEHADVLRNDYVVAPVLKIANDVEIGFIGLGDIESSLIFSHGFLEKEEVAAILAGGAIGEIFGHFYGIDGKLHHTEVENRTISVDFPMRCPIVAVAYGESKVKPIIGAIRGKLIQGLITDEKTAETVLNANW
ncbi:MAG: sugar-binding domain-containing protein [Spirochaetota bacterium]